MKAEINKFLIQQYGCSSKLNKKQPKLSIPSFTRFVKKKRAKKKYTHWPSWETHITSHMGSPTRETHIPGGNTYPF